MTVNRIQLLQAKLIYHLSELTLVAVCIFSLRIRRGSGFFSTSEDALFSPSFSDFYPSLFPSLSLVDLRGGRHLLTSQHSLPGIPVALKQSIDLRTSMDGKYKEIAEVTVLNY